MTIGDCAVDFRAHDLSTAAGAHHRLSDSEVKLLRLLTFRPGEVVSRKEILDHVYGSSALAATRTLDNLVLALRRALESDTRHPRHLHTVRGVGFRLTLAPES